MRGITGKMSEYVQSRGILPPICIYLLDQFGNLVEAAPMEIQTCDNLGGILGVAIVNCFFVS